MRTGTFHTLIDIYHQNIHIFLSIREVLLLLLHSLSFFLIAGHVHFRKAGHDLWMGMDRIAFGKKKGKS